MSSAFVVLEDCKCVMTKEWNAMIKKANVIISYHVIQEIVQLTTINYVVNPKNFKSNFFCYLFNLLFSKFTNLDCTVDCPQIHFFLLKPIPINK